MQVKLVCGYLKMPNEILLLDIGNTRLKWAWQQGELFVPGGELTHTGQLRLNQLAQISREHSPAKIVAACVAGDKIKETVVSQLQRQFAIQVELITTPSEGQGIRNGYVQPAQLGIDRWVAMVGAHQMWPGYLCVIDAGSALTLDIIQSDGQHQGGYILPGLRMMQTCVIEKTAIPMSLKAVIMASTTQPGNDTQSCLANGTLQGTCGLIERTVLQVERETGESVQCVLTGGDSQYLAATLSVPHVIEPYLVLKGLAHIVSDRTKTA